MNITDRLAESLFRPSCRRCGRPGENVEGEQIISRRAGRVLIGSHRLCPACVVDFDWWLDTPPENPDTDSLSSTDALKGEADAVRRPL